MTSDDVNPDEFDGEFHPNAHPKATTITGNRDYGVWGQCVTGARHRDGDRCEQCALGPHGKCHWHGGAKGTGAPEGNQNAVGNSGGDGGPEGNAYALKHGLYAEHDKMYQNFSDGMQSLADEIYTDYHIRYTDRHGETPPTGIDLKLFKLGVNHVKEIFADNWAMDKPAELDTGNPMVDKETKYTDDSTPYRVYKETVTLAGQKKLSTDTRQWLKDLGLLDDPDDVDADAGFSTLADALLDSAGSRSDGGGASAGAGGASDDGLDGES